MPSCVILHLQEHLFHVRQPQFLLARTLERLQRVQLARRDLVALDRVRLG